jgi:spore maturation protein CgeB
MRILMIQPGPNFSVADVHDGWAEALRGLGQHVIEYNLDRRITFYDAVLMADDLYTEEGRSRIHKALTREQAVELAANGTLSAAMQTWPDVVFITSAFFIPTWVLEVFRARRMKIVMLFTESPYQDGQQLEIAKYADVILLNDPVSLPQYREFGVPAEYVPHAYRPSVHHPPLPGSQLAWDLVFVGTGFPSRVKFFSQMDISGLDVHLAGPWLELPEDSPLRDWTSPVLDNCVDNADTADIYRSAKCGINFYRREGEDGAVQGVACGPREIEMAACGLFFVRDSRPESDELFGMLPSYTTPGQAGDLVRWYAAHPAERERRAAAAREAIADRTFTSHARKLLAMLDT